MKPPLVLPLLLIRRLPEFVLVVAGGGTSSSSSSSVSSSSTRSPFASSTSTGTTSGFVVVFVPRLRRATTTTTTTTIGGRTTTRTSPPRVVDIDLGENYVHRPQGDVRARPSWRGGRGVRRRRRTRNVVRILSHHRSTEYDDFEYDDAAAAAAADDDDDEKEEDYGKTTKISTTIEYEFRHDEIERMRYMDESGGRGGSDGGMMGVEYPPPSHPPSPLLPSSRRFVIAYAAGMLGLLSSTIVPSTCALAAASSSSSSNSLTVDGNYMRSPINKRSGVTLDEPERIYPISFITYLSRFLLVFDDSCQKYWYTLAGAIPPNSDKDAVERVRFSQFGQFAASVEVGLLDFEDGKEGVRRLLDSLVERYGPSFSSSSSSMSTSLGGNGYVDVVAGKVVGAADPSTLSSSTLVGNDAIPSSTTTVGSRTTTTTPPPPPTTTTITEREVRKSKEALRQIALLFSLINSEYQPVDSITQLLAVDDDAIIDDVDLVDGGAGYATDAPVGVTFPDPPTLGTKFGGTIARGVAVMRRTGRILRVDLIDGGSGYATAPTVEISVGGGSAVGEGAIARAYLGRKKLKGSVDRIEIVYPGSGYGSGDGDVVVVTVSPPEGKDGVAATARATLEYEVERVNVIDGGRGYAAEKPINVVIDPPPSNPGGVAVRSAFAVSYPKGKSTSYGSFIGPNSETVVSASISNVDTSQWIMGPTSSQLLALLPSGFGLQYDDGLGRYVLSRSSSTNDWEDILAGRLEGQKFKPLNPIFGIRGRSPIERERALDVSTVVRFMASGGICSSIAHLVLTPIDVVKTKVQTKPDVYDMGIFGTFKKVLEEGGMNALFNGWEPTFVGFFLTGGVGFFLTEYFRRYYSSLITTVMSLSEVSATTVLSSWEIPLIAASAATSGFFCCFILAPFDAVRIRTVSQPDYADNILGVVSRMIGEEGLLSLFSSVPVWFVKEIPYNVFKFLVFDTATDFLYELFPAAREDIRLSLLVSLFGGTLGGMAATIASNPADVVISELKKSKTEMSAWEAVERVKDRAGGYLPAFSTGLSLRMIFISLLVSLQFFLYDSVRIALGVGSDDMKLYLNVLGAALNKSAASS